MFVGQGRTLPVGSSRHSVSRGRGWNFRSGGHNLYSMLVDNMEGLFGFQRHTFAKENLLTSVRVVRTLAMIATETDKKEAQG